MKTIIFSVLVFACTSCGVGITVDTPISDDSTNVDDTTKVPVDSTGARMITPMHVK